MNDSTKPEMSEQQRVLLAISLTFGVIFGWQYMMGEYLAPVVQPESMTDILKEGDIPQVVGLGGTGDSAKGAKHALDAGSNVRDEEVTGHAQGNGDESATMAIDSPASVVTRVATKAYAVEHPKFNLVYSNSGPSISTLELKDYEESLEEKERELVSLVLASEAGRPSQAHFSFTLDGEKLNETFEATLPKPDTIQFTGKLKNQIRVEIEAASGVNNFGIHYNLRFLNVDSLPHNLNGVLNLALAIPEDESSMFAPSMQMFNSLCFGPEGLERFEAQELAENGGVKVSSAKWVAIDRQYFVVAAQGEQTPVGEVTCESTANEKRLNVGLQFMSGSLAPGQASTANLIFYAGPKRVEDVEKVAMSFSQIIDYNIMGIPLGFIARPMIYMLNFFNRMTGSWGFAIILLTLLVKLLLFPFTFKSVVSMRKMQLLKPQLDKIKEKFPDDRERQQLEQIKIFKETGVNPLGGCLPMILQMPVWFALYRALWTSVDLYQQSFLWIVDLTTKEPFPFLALALGVLTFVQQKLTPTTMDSDQAKMMMVMMPIMLTVFMLALPSGLVLYILVNSVLTIIQQLVINKRVPKLAT